MRNLGLDLLKVLACFCVVSLHTVGTDISIINSIIYYISGCAVPIFFMVNGNLLLNKSNLNYKYVINKIKNILIIVFVWNIIISFVYFIKGEYHNPFLDTIKSLLQKGYFYQFWFFGALIIIYSVLPIIYYIFRNKRNAITITYVFIGISIFIDLSSLISSYLGYPIIQSYFIQTFRIWTWFAYFLLGGLIGKEDIQTNIYEKISKKNNIIILLCMTVVVVTYQYNISRKLYNILNAEYFYDNILTFIWVLSIFIYVDRSNITFKNYKIFKIISLNIMGIYILHPSLISIINKFYGFNNSITNIILLLFIFAVCLFMSFIISKIPIINRLIKI